MTKRKRTVKKYKQSARGKAVEKKYNHSAKGKAAMKKYNHSAKGKAYQKTWKRSAKGKESMKRNNQTAKHKAYLKKYWTPERRSYSAMVQRCTNPNTKCFENYGGATPPVRVCKRWQGKDGFKHFLENVGIRPAGTTLGRWGDVGPYTKSNCKWMTWKEQRIEQQKKIALRREQREIHQ